MKPEMIEDVLLTVREVFDYAEGLAVDYDGKSVVYLDYELMVVAIPYQNLEDYIEVVLSLADEVSACSRGGYLLKYSADADGNVKIHVWVKPFYRHRSTVYVAFRVLGVECPDCRSPSPC